MAEDAIESITNRSVKERKTIWDRWEEVFDAAEAHFNDPNNDLLENRLVKKITVLSTHMQGQMSKLYELVGLIVLFNRIKKLQEAHDPKMMMVGLYITQIFSSIVAAGLGCAPSILSVTGNAAKSYQAISGGIQGVLGQGSQNMASLLQTKNQGEIAELSHSLETHKMQQSSHQQEFQRQQSIAQRHAEDKKQEEQKRHETTKAINGING